MQLRELPLDLATCWTGFDWACLQSVSARRADQSLAHISGGNTWRDFERALRMSQDVEPVKKNLGRPE